MDPSRLKANKKIVSGHMTYRGKPMRVGDKEGKKEIQVGQ
jgi:hypothetical protein